MALSVPTKLEELRCFTCKAYLSCSPIRLLPNGNFICGQCTPLSTNKSIYRALQLEAILSEALFPCQFKKRGCITRTPFGRSVKHESTCAYRIFTCPALTSCLWEGLTSQLHDHFNEMHSSLIMEHAEFKFNVNFDAEVVFMVLIENLVFIVKYKYNALEKSFNCDIRYCRNRNKTTHDAYYKIQLINGSDVECNLNLKTSKCLLYDNSFYDMQNAVILNFSKCLEILNCPDIVAVVIDLKSGRSCTNNEENLQVTVNYDLLELIRCKICKNYLIPPLFEISSVGIICCNCSKNYLNPKPSNDKKIQKLVTELNYPCQWRDCNFVGKSDTIQTHSLSCCFRCYRCFVSDCNNILTLSSVVNHAQNHKNAEYSTSGIYKTSFFDSYQYKYVYTIKNNVLITIKHCVAVFRTRGEWDVLRHFVMLFSDLNKISISIQFEHEHCKLKSEPVILVSNEVECIILDQLPSCFKENDELSVTISIAPNEDITMENCMKDDGESHVSMFTMKKYVQEDSQTHFSLFTWFFTMFLSTLVFYTCYITNCVPVGTINCISDYIPAYEYITDWITNYVVDNIPDCIITYLKNNVTVV